jgi:type II secretory pathway pseudopilin PulG
MRHGESGSARVRAHARTQQGFAYGVVLAILALLGVALATAGTRWADRVQREREQDLLRVGQLYAQAILAYHRGSPGSDKTWPKNLEDLLLDSRMLGTVRYLRASYGDPMVPGQPFGLVHAADGSIRGVYSTSAATPFRQGPVDLGVTVLAPAQHYSDWQFIPKADP